MSGLADRLVSEARLWLGTPYVHQMACRGAGCDCLGLVRGVWRGVYGAETKNQQAYRMMSSCFAGRRGLWPSIWAVSLRSGRRPALSTPIAVMALSKAR